MGTDQDQGALPPPLSRRAYETLKLKIIQGNFQPGETLKIDALHKTHSLSSSPLRKALNRLAADGLVTSDERRGFRVSDWVGSQISFLRCGPNYHTVNCARADLDGIHHLALDMRERAKMTSACDYLTGRKIQLIWGHLRHVVGYKIAAYHQNPDDLRVELFAELDQMSDESLG